MVINYTESYTYLGAVLSNTSLVAQISQHMKAKQSHMRKFTSFLMKNSDAPYTVKIKVWNSALNAAILYSSETWLTGNLRSVESSYVSTLKQPPVKIELGSRLGSHWDPALYPTGIFGRDPSPHLLGSQSISHHIPLGSQYTSNRDPSTHPTGIPVHIPPYPTGIPVHIQPGSQSISHRNPTISHHIPPGSQ